MAKTLGVIGGLGPAATADFLQRIVKITDAQEDRQHLDAVIVHAPSIPDRSAYLLSPDAPDPTDALLAAAKKLELCGVDCIAIPCVTAHVLLPRLSGQIATPFLNCMEETVACIHAYNANSPRPIHKVGLMATDGTVHGGRFATILREGGLETCLPSAQAQQALMGMIYQDIKAGTMPDAAAFRQIQAELVQNGAELLLLACTELSLIPSDYFLDTRYLDVLDVLAAASVTACGKPIRPQYRSLIHGR